MIFALAKISAVILYFNRRAKTEEDFFEICEEEGVTVVFDDMPILKGFCVRSIDEFGCITNYIFLDKNLRGIEFLFIAFHELMHYFLHVPKKRTKIQFYGLNPDCKEEDEADAGALICLYPKTEIPLLEERKRYCNEFEFKLIEKRLEVHKRTTE